MSAVDPRTAQALAWLRAHGVKIGLELLVNFILPYLIYDFGKDRMGDVGALMASSGPPILWSIVEFIRERKVDAVSILVLAGIALSLLAFAGGGGVKFLQLRENLVTGLVGLVFLGSAVVGKPLIYELARAGARRNTPDKVAELEALSGNVYFRRSMTVMTVVWGVGLLASCALSCALVFVVSIKQYLLISSPISYATMGLLAAWTFWYVGRSKRQGEARRAAAQAPEPGPAV
jgi:intracellular septation protein A